MQLEWYHYLIAVLGSALAGSINTLAGNGSAITLTILTELLGLPGNLANGTNRVGVFTQSASRRLRFLPQRQTHGAAQHIAHYHERHRSGGRRGCCR